MKKHLPHIKCAHFFIKQTHFSVFNYSITHNYEKCKFFLIFLCKFTTHNNISFCKKIFMKNILFLSLFFGCNLAWDVV